MDQTLIRRLAFYETLPTLSPVSAECDAVSTSPRPPFVQSLIFVSLSPCVRVRVCAHARTHVSAATLVEGRQSNNDNVMRRPRFLGGLGRLRYECDSAQKNSPLRPCCRPFTQLRSTALRWLCSRSFSSGSELLTEVISRDTAG